jgi:RimK family alpha-L-glutamate ligase
MKISLITTLPALKENRRIEEEVNALGNQFELVDLSDFNFLADSQVKVEGLSMIDSNIVIVRGIFNSIKPISVLINNLRKKGIKIFDNNFIEHKYSIDKVTDLIKLAQEKISIPKTAYARDFSKYEKMAEEIGYPVVIKSTRSGKGASVFKIDDKNKLKSLIDDLVKEDKKAKSYLLQEFIDYKIDLRCLVIGEHVFTMRRIPAKGEFRANFSLGGSVESYDLNEEGKELAIKALKVVDMSIGGVDILIDKNKKMYILEVNHTAGFVGMEKATEENIAKIFVEHAIKNAK